MGGSPGWLRFYVQAWRRPFVGWAADLVYIGRGRHLIVLHLLTRTQVIELPQAGLSAVLDCGCLPWHVVFGVLTESDSLPGSIGPARGRR